MAMTVETRTPGGLRRLLAVLVLLGLGVGVPAIVVSRVGVPWPTSEQVSLWRRTGRIDTDLVIRLGLLAVGLLWAWFLLTAVDEALRGVSRRQRVGEVARRPNAGGRMAGPDERSIVPQSWVRRLVQIALATGAVGTVVLAAPSILSDSRDAPIPPTPTSLAVSEGTAPPSAGVEIELPPTTLLPQTDVGAPTGSSAPWSALAIGGVTALGIAAALGRQRRRALRASVPGDVASQPTDSLVGWETQVRRLARGEDLARLDWALRAAAPALVAARSAPLVVLVEHDGAISMHVSTPCTPPSGPWHLDPRSGWWRVGAGVPLTELAAAADTSPFVHPTLVHIADLADNEATRVFLHLEQVGHLDVIGDGALDVVRGIALGLATSDHLGAGHVITVGLAATPEWPAALRRVDTAESALNEVRAAVSAEPSRATLGQRRLDSADADEWETWTVIGPRAALEPHVEPLLAAGSSIVTADSAATLGEPATNWRLVLIGGRATLEPLGLVCRPVRAEPATVSALTEIIATPALVPAEVDARAEPESVEPESAEPAPVEPAPAELGPVELGPVHLRPVERGPVELSPVEPAPIALASLEPPAPTLGPQSASPRPALVVRVLGPVRVEAADGTVVEFERSKALELVVWLATHRRRPTRGGARNALWEVEVRSATFHNVISDARRSLARVVTPPDGEEWIGRSQSDLLPLHPCVVCDLDLLDDAVRASKDLDDEVATKVLSAALQWIDATPFTGTDYLWSDAEGIASAAVLSATTAAVSLAERCLALGDIAGVFAATGRGLTVLPGHDALVALRMEAHSAVGDRVSVRAEWERYLRVLAADHETEPPANMSALRNRLLRAGP